MKFAFAFPQKKNEVSARIEAIERTVRKLLLFEL